MEEQKNNGIGFVILEMLVVAIIVLVCLGLMYGGKQEQKPTPTIAPTMTEIPTPTSTPSPTPTPTQMPTFTPTPTPIPSERKEVGQGHTFKPYTRHFVYDVKGTEDTINAGNRYGAVNHDVLEFIVDGKDWNK